MSLRIRRCCAARAAKRPVFVASEGIKRSLLLLFKQKGTHLGARWGVNHRVGESINRGLICVRTFVESDIYSILSKLERNYDVFRPDRVARRRGWLLVNALL